MKIALLTLSALSLAALGHGQAFEDGFEGATFNTAATGGTVTSSVLWTVVNASSPVGSTSVFDGNHTVFTPHAGNQYAGMNFNNGSGISNIDTLLETPVLNLNNGDTFSFWTRKATPNPTDYIDRLFVKLSTSGESTGANSFTQTLLAINPNLQTGVYPTTWTKFTATVSGLSGPTSGRLAFNYNVTNGGPSGANSDYIGIDDVRYQPVPEPASMTALGLGAVAMLRRRRKA